MRRNTRKCAVVKLDGMAWSFSELRNSTVHELWLQVLSLEGVTTGHLSRFQAGREPACTLC